MAERRWVVIAVVGLAACDGERKRSADGDADADSDSDADTDTATQIDEGGCWGLEGDRQGFRDCGEDECTFLDGDPRHCGACGNACPREAPVCMGGACAADCGGLTDCDGGCFDLATSRVHCGRCGAECFGGGRCVDGACTCPEGYTRCLGTFMGDMCTDLEHRWNFCGDCENQCADGEFCYRGTCQDDCGELTACGHDCVDLQTSRQGCGYCEVTCDGAWGTCSEGRCYAEGADSDTDWAPD